MATAAVETKNPNVNKPAFSRRGNPRMGFLYNKKLAPYLFVLPFVISFLVFFLYPTFETIAMSFQKIEGFNSVTFIGLTNYKRLWNEHFFNAIRSSTIYTLCIVCTLVPVPVVLAAMLNSALLKGRNFFRSAVFVPALTSVIIAGVAFRLLYSELDTGFFNMIIRAFGGESIVWNRTYGTGMLMMVSLATWRTTGVNVVYCLSALQSVPEELYESADIDGANFIQKFFKITIPQIKPIIIYILTIAILEGFRMFTEGYVFWNESNPGDIGLTIVRYIYQQAFQRNDMGFGSAIGMVLLLIVLTVNILQLKFFGLFKKEE